MKQLQLFAPLKAFFMPEDKEADVCNCQSCQVSSERICENEGIQIRNELPPRVHIPEQYEFKIGE